MAAASARLEDGAEAEDAARLFQGVRKPCDAEALCQSARRTPPGQRRDAQYPPQNHRTPGTNSVLVRLRWCICSLTSQRGGQQRGVHLEELTDSVAHTPGSTIRQVSTAGSRIQQERRAYAAAEAACHSRTAWHANPNVSTRNGMHAHRPLACAPAASHQTHRPMPRAAVRASRPGRVTLLSSKRLRRSSASSAPT